MGSSAGEVDTVADAFGVPADGCAAAPAPGVVTLTGMLEGALCRRSAASAGSRRLAARIGSAGGTDKSDEKSRRTGSGSANTHPDQEHRWRKPGTPRTARREAPRHQPSGRQLGDRLGERVTSARRDRRAARDAATSAELCRGGIRRGPVRARFRAKYILILRTAGNRPAAHRQNALISRKNEARYIRPNQHGRVARSLPA